MYIAYVHSLKMLYWFKVYYCFTKLCSAMALHILPALFSRTKIIHMTTLVS